VKIAGHISLVVNRSLVYSKNPGKQMSYLVTFLSTNEKKLYIFRVEGNLACFVTGCSVGDQWCGCSTKIYVWDERRPMGEKLSALNRSLSALYYVYVAVEQTDIQ